MVTRGSRRRTGTRWRARACCGGPAGGRESVGAGGVICAIITCALHMSYT
ncbi:hypothetical protein GTW29_32955 [Streptomyces sp. SID7834]|nr:hypothetical protein [Streptomyces sp. SID7815]MYT61468.1 hypothetical protein [Streptomyces sp. SID7834]